MELVVDFLQTKGLAVSEIAFAAAMFTGIASDFTTDAVRNVGMKVMSTVYHGKYRDSHVRDVKMLSPLLQLALTKGAFAYVFFMTIITLDKRPFLWNILKLGYSYTSISKTLPDILTDDDRKAWSPEKKVKHFLLPWEIEDSKKLPNDLTPEGVEKHAYYLLAEGLQSGGGLIEGGVALLTCAIFSMFGPAWLSNLIIASAFPAFLNALNVFYHIGMTFAFQNSFPSMFGNNIKLGTSGTTNLSYGLHYEYFANHNLFFQSWLHTKVYKPWKSTHKSTRLPKMMMILARGALVVLAMLCANYQGIDIGLVMLYYMMHAFGGYYVHGEDLSLLRPSLVFAVEPLVASIFWVGPILNRPLTKSLVSSGPSVFDAPEAIADNLF